MTEQQAPNVTITIDGRPVVAKRGQTVLQAARDAGLYIPHLCDWPGLTPFAGCRMCLVKIEGRRGLDTACTMPVREGMVVITADDEIREMQRNVLEVMLADHPDRCLNCPRYQRCPSFGPCIRDDVVTIRCILCPKHNQCELQRVVDFLELRRQRFYGPRRELYVDRSNPFLELDMNYCIFCARCVRVCDEVRGRSVFSLAYRADQALIVVGDGVTLAESNCEFCGQCAQVCPTGAIMKRDSIAPNPIDRSTPTVCAYCATGCALHLNVYAGRIVSAYPNADNPANGEAACVKGQFGYDYVHHPDRLTMPLVRLPALAGAGAA